MFALVKKDFIAGAYFLIGIAILIPFITSMAILAMVKNFSGLVIGVFTIIVLFMCIASSLIFIGVDNISKTDMIYASLPIKRSTIVLARYNSSFLLTIASFTLVLLTIFSYINTHKSTDLILNTIVSFRGIIGMISFLLLVISFIMPFIFKYGPGRGILVASIVQVIIMFFYPVLEFIQKALNGILVFDISFINNIPREVLRWIISLPSLHAYLLISSMIVMIAFISIILSIRFYNKKDL